MKLINHELRREFILVAALIIVAVVMEMI